MKILVISGSPRRHGNTCQVTKRIEDRIRELDNTVEFDHVFLGDADIKMCLGCRACFDRGEACCPHKDDIPEIAARMLKADGVIFSSPTYVVNMSGIMKNFFDRLAYFCHRPAFHDKAAMIVSTTAGTGAQFTLIMMSLPIGAIGFHVEGKLGIAMKTGGIVPIPERYIPQINKKAGLFLKALKEKGAYPPSLFNLVSFYTNKGFYNNPAEKSYDAAYWKAQGWLEPGREYFTDVRVGAFKKLVARIVLKLIKFV